MPLFRPTRPRFRATFSTDTAFAAGENTLTWDNVDYDDVAGYSTPAYTCDRPGLYLVHSSVTRINTASVGQGRLWITVNGTKMQRSVAASVATHLTNHQDLFLELAAGDAVTVIAQLHPTISASIEAAGSDFSVVRLGPKAWT